MTATEKQLARTWGKVIRVLRGKRKAFLVAKYKKFKR